MKKLILLIILVVVLGIGGFFGYKSWNRNRLLNSGKVLVLLNEKEGFYTYSDFLDPEDIDRNYDILGLYENLSEVDVKQLTEGYQLRIGMVSNPSDPRIPQLLDREVQVPSEDQKDAWLSLVNNLPQQQKDLCNKIEIADQAQQCFIQHHVFNISKQNGTRESCDGIFIDAAKEDCYRVLDEGIDQSGADRNNNMLIDSFEALAGNAESLRQYYDNLFTQ